MRKRRIRLVARSIHCHLSAFWRSRRSVCQWRTAFVQRETRHKRVTHLEYFEFIPGSWRTVMLSIQLRIMSSLLPSGRRGRREPVGGGAGHNNRIKHALLIAAWLFRSTKTLVMNLILPAEGIGKSIAWCGLLILIAASEMPAQSQTAAATDAKNSYAVAAEKYAPQVQALLSRMTLEEKIGQMTQLDIQPVIDGVGDSARIDPAKLDLVVRQHAVGSLFNAPGGGAVSGEQCQ